MKINLPQDNKISTSCQTSLNLSVLSLLMSLSMLTDLLIDLLTKSNIKIEKYIIFL